MKTSGTGALLPVASKVLQLAVFKRCSQSGFLCCAAFCGFLCEERAYAAACNESETTSCSSFVTFNIGGVVQSSYRIIFSVSASADLSMF